MVCLEPLSVGDEESGEKEIVKQINIQCAGADVLQASAECGAFSKESGAFPEECKHHSHSKHSPNGKDGI